MSKIKQINISDFRIYQEKQEFKFHNKRGIANLVAIYAPNGYGKTSFFDAIEWGYSDKIQRLEQKITNDSIKNEEDFGKEDKVILTNRTSYDSGKKGVVEVFTADKSFQKEVVFRKVQNVETRNDYRPGRFLHSDFQKADLKELPETNVLSQDQIDSFLRYKTPEQKFDNLKEFWLEGEVTLNKYKKIEDAIKSIYKSLNKFTEKQTDLKEELEEIVYDTKKIKELNDSLNELKKEELLKFELTPLKESLNKESFDLLSKQLNLAKKGLSKIIESEEKKKHHLTLLTNDFSSFKENETKLQSVNDQVKQIIDKKKSFDDLKAATQYTEELENHLTKVNSKLSDYKRIARNRTSFLASETRLKELKKNQKVITEKSQKLDIDTSVIKKWISSLSRTKSNYQDKHSKYLRERENYTLIYERYTKDAQTNKVDNRILSELEKKIKLDKEKIQTQNELVSKYQNLLEEKNWRKDTIDDNMWVMSVEHYESTLEKLKKKRADLKEKQEYLQKSGSLDENLEKVKLWGKEYIQETKSPNCPLCNSKFETIENLIAAIDLNKSDVLKISDQAKAIAQLKKSIEELEESLNASSRYLESELKDLIKKIKKENELLHKLKEEDENSLSNVQRRIKLFLLEYNSFKLTLKENLKEGEEFSEVLIPQLIERLTRKESEFDSKIKRIQCILDWKFEFSERKSKEKVELTESKIKSDQEIIDQEGNELFKVTIKLIEKYKIDNSTFADETLFNTLILDEEREVREKTNVKAEGLKKIKEINEKIDNSKCKIDKLELAGNLTEIENKKEVLEKSIKQYENDYSRKIQNPTFSLQELREASADCETKTNLYCKYDDTLQSILSELELLEGGVRKQEIEKQLKDIENKKSELNKLKEKVESLRNSCMSYIQSGISNYFNKDIINQIYQRIEPHPDLKEIEFKAKMGNKGPRLIITAKGSDEVNPNLYLSAGQVNVLSLSIFLAKTFEYGKDTISTIFMDDPIQNLSDINILSFIDILRTLTNEHDKQIVISTHDEKFFRLLQNKLPEEFCNSKYIEFKSEGKILN